MVSFFRQFKSSAVVAPMILFVVSFIFIFPYLKASGILASGESSVYLNASYLDYYSAWEGKLNAGVFSSYQSNICLYSILWKIISIFSGWVHPSIVYIFLSYFLSGLFLYFCLDYFFQLKNKIIYVPACLMYSYNVFRVLGPLNERLNLLFIFLPLFFLFYYKLLYSRKWRYVFIISLISLLSSSMGANLPVFSISYLMMVIVFCVFASQGKFKGVWKDILLKNAVLFVMIILSNLFWMIPTAVNLMQFYDDTGRGNSDVWRSAASGTFFDHFRFLGSWAWHGGGDVPYYAFASSYDDFFLIFTTYFVSFVSLLYLININKEKKNLIVWIVSILLLVSFLFLSGSKGALGFIFGFLYNKVPLFSMYREPFAKFTPLFILSMSFALVFSLKYLEGFFKKKLFGVFLLFVTSLVLINAYPFFNGEAIPVKSWSNGKKDFLAVIPDYWIDMQNFLGKRRLDDNLFTFPYNTYGTSYNWRQGGSFSGNVADYLINRRMVRAWDIDDTGFGLIMKEMFKNPEYDFNKVLGLINSISVLKENDLEWRYSDEKIYSPLVAGSFLDRFNLKTVFGSGKFADQDIEDVFNMKRGNKLGRFDRAFLLNSPVLTFYKTDPKYFLAHFYVPKKRVVLDGDVSDMFRAISKDDYAIRTAFFFGNQNDKNINVLEEIQEDNGNESIEFRRISPTKYRVRIHNAKKTFPVVFSENFHKDWKLYLVKKTSDIFDQVKNNEKSIDLLKTYKILDGNEDEQSNIAELKELIGKRLVTSLGDLDEKEKVHYNYDKGKKSVDYVEKYQIDFISKNFNGTIQNDNLSKGHFWETWLKRSLQERNHLVANGYSNAWIVNPDNLCEGSGLCYKNDDGGYDMELVVEFGPQKWFMIELSLSLLIFVASVVLLLRSFKKNENKKNK